jgi:hypothetical protein
MIIGKIDAPPTHMHVIAPSPGLIQEFKKKVEEIYVVIKKILTFHRFLHCFLFYKYIIYVNKINE